MKYLKYIIISLLFIGCNKGDSSFDGSHSGKGGSTARFAIVDNYLYTVDSSSLNIFSIEEFSNPIFINEVNVGFNIETLFAYGGDLYIGSQNGMFIYSMENPENPVQQAAVEHFTSCDPVVTDGEFAYVTLHSNSQCGVGLNSLHVYDVTNIHNPILLQEINMTSPKGLGLYNDYLIVCDDIIKIFDVSDPSNIEFERNMNINGFDVIIDENHLIVVGEDGLYQYELDPENIDNIVELSTISY